MVQTPASMSSLPSAIVYAPMHTASVSPRAEDTIKEAQTFLARALPVLAAADVGLAAATLKAAADIAIASVSDLATAGSANGASAAVHARAAAVMSLITCNGALLRSLASEGPAVPAAQPADGSERSGEELAELRSSPMQDSAAAAAPSDNEAAGPPRSGEQSRRTMDGAADAGQDANEPETTLPNTATEEVQTSPAEDQADLAAAQQSGPDVVTPSDCQHASSAGEGKQQETVLQQGQKEIWMKAAEAKHHCLMVSFAPAPRLS